MTDMRRIDKTDNLECLLNIAAAFEIKHLNEEAHVSLRENIFINIGTDA